MSSHVQVRTKGGYSLSKGSILGTSYQHAHFVCMLGKYLPLTSG